MPTPRVQDLIDLYVQESRNESIPASAVGQPNWIAAKLALENFEGGRGFGPDDIELVEDWKLFKNALA